MDAQCAKCTQAITQAADGAWVDVSGACGCGDDEHSPAAARTIRIIVNDYDSDEYEESYGDCEPLDTVDETINLDEDDDPVNLAVTTIRREYDCTEPSCSHWFPGTWYSTSYTFQNGYRQREVSAHLSGFSEIEERAIYALVTAY